MSTPCRKYKSTLVDTTIKVIGTKYGAVPIDLKVVAYELSYGPVIDLTITASVPYTNPVEWSDHPFLLLKQQEAPRTSVSDIIDDTPAVRAILTELVQPEEFKLYTTTDCTHRAALIASLKYFWS